MQKHGCYTTPAATLGGAASWHRCWVPRRIRGRWRWLEGGPQTARKKAATMLEPGRSGGPAASCPSFTSPLAPQCWSTQHAHGGEETGIDPEKDAGTEPIEWAGLHGSQVDAGGEDRFYRGRIGVWNQDVCAMASGESRSQKMHDDRRYARDDITPIFKDKNRMHKRLMCTPGIGRTHK
jgi:hypothetical protein